MDAGNKGAEGAATPQNQALSKPSIGKKKVWCKQNAQVDERVDVL